MIILFIMVWLVLAGSVFPVYANPVDQAVSSGEPMVAAGEKEQDNFRDLLAVMEETTSIATKTRMNADFVPGMVTILYGDELELKGVAHVLDALSLVPGLHIAYDDLVMRGIEKWGSGKIKLLLDGVSVNHSVTADSLPPLFMPIQLIDRIEVIRGPGSAMYGENAFLGVINIIPRTAGQRGFVSYGGYKTFTGGGYYTHASPNGGLKWSLNLAGFASRGEHVMSGEDILYSPAINQPAISNAPGPVSERKRQRTGLLTLDFKHWLLTARYLDMATGDAFGTTDALPPPEDRLIWKQAEMGVTLQKSTRLQANLESTIKLGWSRYVMRMDRLNFFPPGFVSLDPVTGGPFFHPEGVVGSNYVQEEYFNGGMDLSWKGWEHHKVLLGLELSTTRLIDAWTEANVDPMTLEPKAWNRVATDQAWIKKGVHRDLTSLTLQDQYAVTDQLDWTTGLRMDLYDDVGTAVTPRVALVYRLTDQHILKAQYGRSFRPPTFFEMYSKNFVIVGNPQIQPETVDTYELGYVYRRPRQVGRVTLFHSTLKNMISGDNLTGKFRNSPGATLDGVELELEYALTDTFKVDGNISYLHSRDESTGQDMEFSANWLGNAGILWQPWVDHILSIQSAYVGERNRAPGDARDRLGSDFTINLTGTKRHFLQNELTLRVSILNLFDAAVVEAAPPDLPSDFSRPGRTWRLTVSYDF